MDHVPGGGEYKEGTTSKRGENVLVCLVSPLPETETLPHILGGILAGQVARLHFCPVFEMII